MGSGEGLCPPQLGVWGLAPRKKINFALKIMQFWASFGTSFLYNSRKWGDYPPSPESGATYPPVPPAPTPMAICHGQILSRAEIWQLSISHKYSNIYLQQHSRLISPDVFWHINLCLQSNVLYIQLPSCALYEAWRRLRRLSIYRHRKNSYSINWDISLKMMIKILTELIC